MTPLLRFAAQTAIVAATAYAAVSVAASLRRRRPVLVLPRLSGGPEGERGAPEHERPAAFSEEVADETAALGPDPVRPSGRRAMRDPHRRWSEVDEASDESFPTSDPPAKY